MRVLITGAEAAPLAKVGGLGDVLGALPHALARRGHDVVLMLPAYASVLDQVDTHDHGPLDVRKGRGESIPTRLLETWLPSPRADGLALRVLLIDQPWYFGREGIYNDPSNGAGFGDDHERWLAFSMGIAPACERLRWFPEVLHANDSHTGPVLALRATRPRPGLWNTATLFSVHNLAYQGWYGRDVLRFAGWDPDWHADSSDPLEFQGGTNFMKMGIACSDLVNTVSERYAYEIRTDPALGCGLEGLLASRGADVRGVVNGIDVDTWDPATDPHLDAHYSLGDPAGKRICRDQLLEQLDLRPAGERTVVFGMVSRLTIQKGIDLVIGAVDHMMHDDLRLVVLGSGAESYQHGLAALQARYPDRVRALFGFSEAFAHRIEAGADAFLMPSRYEPCGLNQMYSMRYGTVPVTRYTGGLVDTVQPFDPWNQEGCGFHFSTPSSDALLDAVGRAVLALRHDESRAALMRNCMARDFSWDRAAVEYERLYAEVAGRRG